MEILKKIILLIVAVTLFAGITPAAYAKPGDPVGPNTIPCPGNLPCLQEDTQKDPSKVRSFIIDTFGGSFLKGFLGLAAVTCVIFIIVGGLQMHLAFGNEEAIGKAKKTLIWAIVGLVIAILSAAIVQIVSNIYQSPQPASPPASTSVLHVDAKSYFAAAPLSSGEIDSKVGSILPPDVVEGKLPAENFKTAVIPQIIKILLGLVGAVSFGVFVYAGVMLIIAQGNEEEITKFKNILIWSLVGLAFITTAYAIVNGVMQIVFK